MAARDQFALQGFRLNGNPKGGLGVIPPLRMRRRFRVRSRGEFQRVYQEGRSYANRAAVLYALPGGEGASRAGFAAGRKLGSAVVRNRVKRRLREAVQLVWGRVRPGAAVIFIARPPAKEMRFDELCAKVAELVQRAGLLAPQGPVAPGRQKG